MNDKWQHTFQIDETECVVASIYKSVIHQYVITQKRERDLVEGCLSSFSFSVGPPPPPPPGFVTVPLVIDKR